MLIIISGPPAAGKTTISRTLVKRFSKSVYLSKDYIYNSIKSGNFAPWENSIAAKKQFSLNNRIIELMIKNYVAGGYIVVVEGVFGDKEIQSYRKILKNAKAFLLLPSLKDIQIRDRKRSKNVRMPHRLKPLHDSYKKMLSKNFIVIDNSKQTVKQTTDIIFSQINENRH